MLEVDRTEMGDVTVVHLEGNLDALTAPTLKREVEALLSAQCHKLIFDFAKLELIDSSGVGAVVSLFKRARGLRGDARIARMSGQPAEVFRLLRLDRAFEVHSDLEQAVREFG